MKITAGLIIAAFATGLLSVPQRAKAELITYEFVQSAACYDGFFGGCATYDEVSGIYATGSYTIDTSLGGFPSGVSSGSPPEPPTGQPIDLGGLVSFEINAPYMSFYISPYYYPDTYFMINGLSDIVYTSPVLEVLTILGGAITVGGDLACYAANGILSYTCTYVGSWSEVSVVPEPPDNYLFITFLCLIGLLWFKRRVKDKK